MQHHANEMPHNLKAEENIIGSLLVDNDSAYKVIDRLKPSHFYNLQNKIIYETFLELYLMGNGVDITILSSRLTEKSTGIMASQLARTMADVLTASMISQYADIVIEKSVRRDIIKASHENNKEATDEEKDIVGVLASVQNRVFSIGPEQHKNTDMGSVVKEVKEMQEVYAEKYRQGKKLLGFSSGIEKLDKYTDGIRDGKMWAIGAWHGTGKTSFALNILHELMKQRVPVAFISLEMTSLDIAAKIIGIRHGLSSMKVLKGRNDVLTQEKIQEGEEFLKSSDMNIFHEYDIEKIRMIIRKDVHTRKTKVFVIDYIQKLMHEKIFDQTQLMAYAAKSLANLSQELGITIVVLSQISNEAQKGNGAGAGFKGAGDIEASADLSIVLQRNKEKELPDQRVVPIDILITKNKFGLDGRINYHIHLTSGAFNAEFREESKV